MIIKNTTEYDVKFTIEAHWNEEGGMGSDEFGSTYDNFNDAIFTLELARKSKPKEDWIIVGRVNTKNIASK